MVTWHRNRHVVICQTKAARNRADSHKQHLRKASLCRAAATIMAAGNQCKAVVTTTVADSQCSSVVAALTAVAIVAAAATLVVATVAAEALAVVATPVAVDIAGADADNI